MVAVVLLLCRMPAAHGAQEYEPIALTVLADDSLALPLSAIVRDYSATSKHPITLVLAPVKEHAQHIVEGDPADVLITPQPQWIEQMRQQGLLDAYTDQVIAYNRLALLGSVRDWSEVTLSPSLPIMLRQHPQTPVVFIGNPESIASGDTALETLRTMDVMQDVEPFWSFVDDSAYMVRMLEHPGNFALAFASLAHHAQHVHVFGTARDRDGTHATIPYRAVVVAGEHMDVARHFIHYLNTPEARTQFSRYGLDVP